MKKIIIYSSAYCPYCSAAKALLEQKKLIFKEILIDNDNTVKSKMIELSEGRKTVPQIFFGESHIGGFDDLKKISDDGNLEKILNDE